jgi:hypothetical protein
LTSPSGLLYLASSQDIKAVSAGPWEPPPALWLLLKELSNFRVGRGIYLGNSGNFLCTWPELKLG